MSFQVGDKVVCVDAKGFANPERHSSLPVEGAVYVIRDRTCRCFGGVLLVGIRGDVDLYQCGHCGSLDIEEKGFRASRFRKLDEVKRENAIRASVGRPATIAEAVRIAWGQRANLCGSSLSKAPGGILVPTPGEWSKRHTPGSHPETVVVGLNSLPAAPISSDRSGSSTGTSCLTSLSGGPGINFAPRSGQGLGRIGGNNGKPGNNSNRVGSEWLTSGAINFVSGSTESRRARTRRDGTGRVNPPWGLLAREQRQAKARHSGRTDSSRDRVRPAHDSLSAHPKPGTVSLDRPDARVCANEPTAPNRIG